METLLRIAIQKSGRLQEGSLELLKESGLSFTWYLWQDGNGTNPTGDIYAACVVAFGVKAGREIVNPDLPGEVAAGGGMDKAGLRIVETAAS